MKLFLFRERICGFQLPVFRPKIHGGMKRWANREESLHKRALVTFDSVLIFFFGHSVTSPCYLYIAKCLILECPEELCLVVPQSHTAGRLDFSRKMWKYLHTMNPCMCIFIHRIVKAIRYKFNLISLQQPFLPFWAFFYPRYHSQLILISRVGFLPTVFFLGNSFFSRIYKNATIKNVDSVYFHSYGRSSSFKF